MCPGIGSGRRGDRVREPLRGASALRLTALSLAFPLLALTAGATVAQSLRMGPYVAALGLAGTFVVPLAQEFR